MAKEITLISEEQKKFLKEQKGLLFEYYAQVSNPRLDTRILGDLQVWVYGGDRKGFTPHCHVMKADKSVEWEVSILDWTIINVKNGTVTGSMESTFNKWLNAKSTRDKNKLNKEIVYVMWDSVNPNNDLLEFTETHNTEITDNELKQYINDIKEELSNGKEHTDTV